MKFIVELLIKAFILLVTTRLVPGFTIDSWTTALIVALVLALLNTFIKPILVLLTLPATILSLGLFLFIINAILLMIAASFVNGFTVDSFMTALVASVVITLLSLILNAFLG